MLPFCASCWRVQVNATNLERVRRIKSHSLRLTDDVASVRTVLDKLVSYAFLPRQAA